MRKAQNNVPCCCMVCIGCGDMPKVPADWAFTRLRFGWIKLYCHRCGSIWLAWHWLEDRTGITVRRARVLNPGGLSPTLIAALLVLDAQRKGEYR